MSWNLVSHIHFVAYGGQDETEFIILIRYTVFLQWKCSPTVDTSQTHLYFKVAKLLQKSEMRKDIVIELSYKGFS